MKSLLQKRTIVLSKEDFIVAITKENPLFKEFSSDGVSKFQAIGKNKIRLFILQSYKRQSFLDSMIFFVMDYSDFNLINFD